MVLPTLPLLTFSRSLRASLRRRILSSLRPPIARTISVSSREVFIASFARNVINQSSYPLASFSRGFASLSSSSLYGPPGGGGGIGGGGGGGGGGDGGNSGDGFGREKGLETKVEEASSLDSDVIILDVGVSCTVVFFCQYCTA